MHGRTDGRRTMDHDKLAGLRPVELKSVENADVAFVKGAEVK